MQIDVMYRPAHSLARVLLPHGESIVAESGAMVGMTPNVQADRLHIDGRLPGGDGVGVDSGFFVKGTRVFQVTAMGKALPPDALATFFDNIKLPT